VASAYTLLALLVCIGALGVAAVYGLFGVINWVAEHEQ
jgi:type II secretory pathway pseudopilin PulG